MQSKRNNNRQIINYYHASGIRSHFIIKMFRELVSIRLCYFRWTWNETHLRNEHFLITVYERPKYIRDEVMRAPSTHLAGRDWAGVREAWAGRDSKRVLEAWAGRNSATVRDDWTGRNSATVREAWAEQAVTVRQYGRPEHAMIVRDYGRPVRAVTVRQYGMTEQAVTVRQYGRPEERLATLLGHRILSKGWEKLPVNSHRW